MSGRREKLILWGLVVVQSVLPAPVDLLDGIHGSDPSVQLAACPVSYRQRLLALSACGHDAPSFC